MNLKEKIFRKQIHGSHLNVLITFSLSGCYCTYLSVPLLRSFRIISWRNLVRKVPGAAFRANSDLEAYHLLGHHPLPPVAFAALIIALIFSKCRSWLRSRALDGVVM